ncbi:MAG: response regulator [Verrucomicrobia bacterium]|nr:response regulator [Verrucomicrobiota bacterium]
MSEPTRALVLVVDDEYGPRESIAYTLATEFAVETAERAAEALKKIKATQFAAVVMDIRMPEMDGIRAVEELRKIDPLVSVIMLTGYGPLATEFAVETAERAEEALKKIKATQFAAVVMDIRMPEMDGIRAGTLH